MKKILLLAGGWEGHQPEQFVQILADALRPHGVDTEIVDSLDPLADADRLKTFAAISPCWTMGSLSDAQSRGLQEAVTSGVGLCGIHGGMGDAFRGNIDYEWMVGGHFVGHPHVGDYTVTVRDRSHPACRDLPAGFAYQSEQYYMLVDPGIHVLADTVYRYEEREVTMPVAWTKPWGRGRVFYSALGHQPDEYRTCPEARNLAVNGMLWAAGLS